MCGIFGYVGTKQAGPLLLEGLKKLEYRGYDSCGIGTFDDGQLHVRKGVGKIDEVEKTEKISGVPGTTGLSHSRWATHGGVTSTNAHPHTDCQKSIAVVHNGIIENYQELKKELQTKGHRFTSQTDTEIIAHLIESQAAGTLAEKVRAATLQLHGSFALLVISTNDPHTLVAVRNESPMAIGLGVNEFFAASDVMPFLEHTKNAVFLEDGEMAVLTKAGVTFMDVKNGTILSKLAKTLDWDSQSATKMGHPHFMIKEILEQPAAIKNALVQDPEKLDRFVTLLKQHADVKFVACGTSRHAALVGRYAMNQLSGKSAEVYIASEFSYFADQCTKDTLIVAVSQSGETADVLVGLRKAKAKGAKIASLVNVAGSSIDRESDVCLYLNCGPEIAVASTKAFTAQLSVLYLLAYTLAGQKNAGIAHLKEVARHAADRLPKWQTQTQKLAESWTQHEHVYFLGRGVNFPVALEGALKLKEISYIHAEGMPAGELKHGTLALIEKNTPVILINPHDYTFSDTLSNGMETKARGAKLIGLSDSANEAYDEYIALPKMPELFYPLVAVLPLQLLAYHAAVLRKNDPDRPRNLAKSVTVR
ncbi:glutamine--fructose-6-phosphate transaminase (isomerizing) [Candidatus Micrarchaeota archaeon]|nr:glutamine--fructose-6-phosphate transaminase (isomerizing) [Candidatus Micrarchaeota archaeon]